MFVGLVIGYIIGLAGVAWAFYSHSGAGLLMFFLLLFCAAHAIGQGAVIWVFIAEIFPNKVRAIGQSFGASIHWVFAALITLVTPSFLDAEDGIFKDNPWPIFGFFCFYDGVAVDLGVDESAGDKRNFFGRFGKETG